MVVLGGGKKRKRYLIWKTLLKKKTRGTKLIQIWRVWKLQWKNLMWEQHGPNRKWDDKVDFSLSNWNVFSWPKMTWFSKTDWRSRGTVHTVVSTLVPFMFHYLIYILWFAWKHCLLEDIATTFVKEQVYFYKLLMYLLLGCMMYRISFWLLKRENY